MNRLDAFLLMLLGGLGWGCGFALIGLGLFSQTVEGALPAIVFGGCGGVAGVLLVALRLAMQRQLPLAMLRPAHQGGAAKRRAGVDESLASAFSA